MKTTRNYAELETKYGRLSQSNMKDIDYPNKTPETTVYWLRFAGGHCPVCGDDHWCLINVTGTKVICMRVANKSGHKIKGVDGWLHELGKENAVKFDPSKVKHVQQFELDDHETLDTVNRLVLRAYPLTSEHTADLKKRGLSEQMIKARGSRGFGSFYHLHNNPDGRSFAQAKMIRKSENENDFVSSWETIFEKLNLPKNMWQGVPGFAYDQYMMKKMHVKLPKFDSKTEGMLVPYYDEYNRVVGFQIRADHVRKTAKIVKGLEKNIGTLSVYINDADEYTVYLHTKSDEEIIKKGRLAEEQKEVTFTYGTDIMTDEITFKISHGGKYFWVSSSSFEGGAANEGKTPVQVSYNPVVASFDPYEDKEKLKKYQNLEKAIWVTEGGLKAIVATDNLSKQFSAEQQKKYGRDFLAVAGVSSYRKFIPMLKKLHVTTVTTAFDMDFIDNEHVAKSYKSLLAMLVEQGFNVQIAYWNPNEAKGIDDALVAGVPVMIKPFKNSK